MTGVQTCALDRKSTRLNSSHTIISYAVFCLKKNKREESFFGHVHRPPSAMRYAHGATKGGDLVYVRARIVLDVGAYFFFKTAAPPNAASFPPRPSVLP